MTISNKRIFFGHQSVGNNIIDGLSYLSLEALTLPIVESRLPTNKERPCLYHCRIGQNQEPLSKIEDFVTLMDSGYGNAVEIACFKFCYIDIDRNTNVELLFANYKSAVDSLLSKYKNTRIMHITVPLRTVEPNTMLFLKKLLGKKSIAIADNRNRNFFNYLVKETYNGKQPIFDLAKAESTFPSGRRCKNSVNGDLVYSLVPQYTYDGGHLNKQGQQTMAQHFINSIEQIDTNPTS